jgi:hypothetical protein
MMVQRYTGNPNVNQDELLKLDWSRKLGESIASQVILPKDQVETLAIEATRQQLVELQSIIAGQEIPVSPRDNDIVHLDVMSQKLMPLIEQAPAGALPPEMVQPFMQALRHFMMHVQQAKAKGTDVAKYEQSAKQAFAHLTAGHNTPPPPELQPAAAMPSQRGGGGGGRQAAAQSRNVAEMTEASSPTQMGAINEIANPPKPPTAA